MKNPGQGLAGSSWIIAAVSALVFPGLGHFLTGDRLRGMALSAIVIVTFCTGLLLGGQLPDRHHSAPLTLLAEVAVRSTGVLDFAARQMGLGKGEPRSSLFETGNVYLLCAGTMSLLAFFDLVGRTAAPRR